MANAVTTHTLINGGRNLILQFNIVADGTGEYSDYILLDLNDYAGNDPWDDLKVMKLDYTVGDGVSFQLKFGSSLDDHRLFFFTPELESGGMDWTGVGGISSLLNTFDGTIRMTTLGFDTSADEISLTLCMKKKYSPSQT